VIGFVRRSRLEQERQYWRRQHRNNNVEVLDIVDFEQCLSDLSSLNSKIIVYCVAANFKPASGGASDADLALDSVSLTESIVHASCRSKVDKIVLTSSLAAVRGPQQYPLNGECFTAGDWNTVSRLDEQPSFAASYQWSKTESERRALEVVSMYDHEVPLISLCPSMILGPIRDESQIGQSIRLLQSWMDGSRPVESRLLIDVRDAALAHYRASRLPITGSRRYIISHERRVPASMMRSYLEEVVTGIYCDGIISEKAKAALKVSIDNMRCDDKFDGGLIKVGDREVDAAHLMRHDLGVVCRSVQGTVRDAVYSTMCVR